MQSPSSLRMGFFISTRLPLLKYNHKKIALSIDIKSQKRPNHNYENLLDNPRLDNTCTFSALSLYLFQIQLHTGQSVELQVRNKSEN